MTIIKWMIWKLVRLLLPLGLLQVFWYTPPFWQCKFYRVFNFHWNVDDYLLVLGRWGVSWQPNVAGRWDKINHEFTH